MEPGGSAVSFPQRVPRRPQNTLGKAHGEAEPWPPTQNADMLAAKMFLAAAISTILPYKKVQQIVGNTVGLLHKLL